MSIALERNRHP
jgi:hypothetical protein